MSIYLYCSADSNNNSFDIKEGVSDFFSSFLEAMGAMIFAVVIFYLFKKLIFLPNDKNNSGNEPDNTQGNDNKIGLPFEGNYPDYKHEAIACVDSEKRIYKDYFPEYKHELKVTKDRRK